MTTLTKHAEIDGLRIAYDAKVLEPRPWTAMQGGWAAELAEEVPPGPILELCSGVGHIGLVAARRSGRPLVQVDSSAHACALARANAASAWLSDRVEVRCGDLAEMVEGFERFPLIIADQPYITTSNVARFPSDPRVAIDGGHDGLDLARSCLEVIRSVLVPGGRALLQLGDEGQVAAIAQAASPDLELLGHRSAGSTRHVAVLGWAD